MNNKETNKERSIYASERCQLIYGARKLRPLIPEPFDSYPISITDRKLQILLEESSLFVPIF